MTNTIDLLDHGFVRLVSYMQAASENPGWTADLEVVRNARASYDADWRTGEDEGKDANLINRMARDHHSSPFESMVFTFEVKAPIFVVRQWHRHRTWSYNEVSARYAELPEEFYVPTADLIGKQSASNKQMRDMLEGLTNEELRAREEEIQWVQEHCHSAFELYHKLIARGWPRELARTVLPFATYTRMFATVDLHNLFHFLRLRLHLHAQYEIRVYAEALLKIIEQICPVSVAAFKKHSLVL
jgi:thymidylate synthase (FAD)